MTPSVKLSLLSAQLLLATAMLAALAGCASPEPRYYTLAPGPAIDAGAAPIAAQDQEPLLIEVPPVSVPERLNRTNLVLDDGHGALKVMEQERWSAPLPEELRDALSQALQAGLGAVDVYYHQSLTGAAPLYRVNVEVASMHAELGTRAGAVISWTVQRLPDRRAISGRTQMELPAPSGVDAAVAVYRHIVGTAAADIATAIRALPNMSPASSEPVNPLARYNRYHISPEKQEIP